MDMSILAWIVLGLLAGFIGSKLVNQTRSGIVLEMALGVAGAIAGGFVSNALGAPGMTVLNPYSLLVAVAGSALVLVAYHSFFRRA